MAPVKLLPYDILPHGKGLQFLTNTGTMRDGWLEFIVRFSQELSVVDAQGLIDPEVGLELMAQACGMVLLQGEPGAAASPRLGVIAAVRGYEYAVQAFAVGESVRVRVKSDLVDASVVVCEGELFSDMIDTRCQHARITLVIKEGELL